MTQISKQDFLSLVSKSRVIESSQLERWLSTVPTMDAAEVANKMVRDQLLTAWQAKYLLTGRSRLDIGGYRLLERIQRDELGDRFLAIHKQLGRKVDIQVLPADLTHDKIRCEVFIKKASLVAKLDHPHLSHVYDIDQEGGRYFLVTEHVDGVRLAETSRNSLDSVDVARLANQALTGLHFAHDHHVLHGNLSQQDLIISPEWGVKIQNLATSPLRVTSEHATFESGKLVDIRSLARIGSTVLAELKPAKDSGERIELANILNSLATCDTDSLTPAKEQLTRWLENHEPNLPDSLLDDELGEALAAESGSIETGGFDQPIQSQLPALARPNTVRTNVSDKNLGKAVAENDADEEYEDDESDSTPGYFANLARENPVGLVATVLVVGLIVIAGSGYGAYKIFGSSNNSKVGPKNLAAGTNAQKPASARTSASKPAPQDPPSPPVATATDVSLDHPDSIAKFTKKLSRDYGPDVEGNVQPEPVSPPAPEVAVNPPDSDQAAPPAEAAMPAVVGAELNPAPTDVTDNNLPETQPVATTENPPIEPGKIDQPTVASTTAPAPATIVDLAEPFKKFPGTAALPPIEDQAEFKIADLVIDNRFLLGAEIFAPPGISRAKMLFEMERDPNEKQTWIVTLGRGARDKKEPIAKFRKSESEFFFQWLPAASDNNNAGYLQNCLIKLLIPDKFTWLKLRQPVPLDPMIFTAESLSSTVQANLDYLPNPENLAVEILPTAIPETELSPALLDLENGIPGRILLKEDDENAFVWVQVGIELKQRLRVRSDLVCFSQGRIQPLKSLENLNEFAVLVKQQEISLFESYERANAEKAPPGKGEEYDKVRDQLLKQAELSQVLTARAIEYVTVAPKILNQPVGIRVYLKMDGHEVDIARTKMGPE